MPPGVDELPLRAIPRGHVAALSFLLWPERQGRGARPHGARGGWYSLAVVAVIAGAAATHRSRWYVTSAFTTFLCSCCCSTRAPRTRARGSTSGSGETILDVGLAFVLGLGLPARTRRRTAAAAA